MSFSDLPKVRHTLGEHPCEDQCTCDRIDAKSQELKKDRRLENWEKWTAERKKINHELSEALKRAPCSTLLNTSNDMRTIKEEKAVLEYAKISYPHDKYRGNPAFWKVPEALPDLCNSKRPSDYFRVMTKEEKCEIPEIEYVAIPDEIKLEMGYHCWGGKETPTRWNALKYRQQRVEELKHQISHIEPYKPDLNYLYIQGNTFNKDQWRDSLAEIKLRFSADDEQTEEPPSAEYYVQVNDIKITTTSKCTNRIFITFNYDVDSKQISTEYLKVNNATPLALRYHFERCVKHTIFTDIIPEVKSKRVFFFNLNEEIIAPGNSVDIPIWFKTNEDGVYKESWKFCTQPAVWTNDLIVILEGIAFSESFEQKCAEIKERLNEKARKRMAIKTIDEALLEIPRPEGNPVLYTYDKAMVFEAVNQNYSPFTRRPKYLYNRTVVDELEKFYARVKLPSHPDTWNYNIEDLRSVTKQRESYDYDQKMLLEIETIKNKELEKGEKKNVDGKEEESSKKRGTVEQSLPAQLEDVIAKLEQPSVWVNLDRNKFDWTYQILCVCIDKICEEMDELNSTYFPYRTFKYPKVVVQTNTSTIELLEDAQMPEPFRIFGDEKTRKPPPECLKDIPMEDTLKRYKTYYGIPDDQETTGKKKKDKKGKEKKKTKDAKSKKSKSQKVTVKANDVKVEYKINENFDLYGKVEIPPTPPESESTSEGSHEFRLQPSELQDYNRRTYQIFYTNLESAIMRIFNVLENQSQKQIKLNVFKAILESNKRLSKPVEYKAMDLKQAINESFGLQTDFETLPAKEITPRQFWMNEAIERKEEGSLWSILRSPKQPEIQEKPISYPEEQVIFKRRYRNRHALNEVGTVMSNAGIDPFWEDFKEVDIQTGAAEKEEKKEDSGDIQMHSEIQKVMMEVFKEVEAKCPEVCKCEEGEESDEDSFYDDDIPIVEN